MSLEESRCEYSKWTNDPRPAGLKVADFVVGMFDLIPRELTTTWLLHFATRFAGVHSDSNQIRDQFNPFRPFVQWYNTRHVNWYIIPKLESRYAKHRDTSKNYTIIDLALSSYLTKNFYGQAAKLRLCGWQYRISKVGNMGRWCWVGRRWERVSEYVANWAKVRNWIE